MLLFLWLARLRQRWFGTFKRYRLMRQPRLQVEQLENRIVPSVTLQSEYTGIDFGNSGGYDPPDTQGAAGTTSYVETTNQEIAIFSPKSAGTTQISDSLSNFWYTQGKLKQTDGGSELSDPVVTWDEQIQRFIIGDQDVDFTTHVSNFDLAVSKSASPATLTSADWNFFQVKTTQSGFDADYPGNLGWNHDSLVFTLNMFSTGSAPTHVEINSINITALANGTALSEGTNAFQTSLNDSFGLRPTVMHDSKAGDPMWFVEEAGDDVSINVYEMTNGLSNNPTLTPTNLNVTPYSSAVPELQPDGTQITTNTDSRIMKAAMANGLIVAAHQVSNAAGDRDMIQWYVIDTTSGTPVLQQQGDISGGAGTYYSYPGIDINAQGDIGVSYIASGTGSGQFMSMYVTGRAPTDKTGTMETSVLAQAGQANDDGDGRLGDLSGINVDSDGTFWASNEYAASGGAWGTGIAHFTLTSGTTSVSTTANNVSAFYSPNAQTVSLSATLTDISSPTTKVNEGTVTFTVKNGTTTLGSVKVTVSNGTAKVNFNLPAGLAPGKYTIAVSYSDSTGGFTDGGDTSGTLTISPANVNTTANNVTALFSPNAQTVTLSASVTDASISTDTVGEGTVTFTVKNGSTNLGSAQGTVSGGKVSASFSVAALQPPGNYTIAVSYSDISGIFSDSGDTGATLSITPANVTTTAANSSTVFSPNAQTVALSASITDSSISTDTVGEGTVTFTIKNGTTTLGSVGGTFAGGKASANFNLAAGQAAGTYAIAVSYKDSAGNFTDSGDTSGTLTIKPANVTTTANHASAVFSPNTQTLTLSASVADTSISTDTVGEGTVTFTLTDSGGHAIGTTGGTVTGGKANATLNLAADQAAGSYTIAVNYSDSAGNFTDNGDTSGALTIKPANVTTTANATTAICSPNAQTVALSANIADASISTDTVGEGAVTFTVKSGSTTLDSTQGTVSGGKASASFNLAAGQAAGGYTIAVSYSDSAGNFTDSGDTSATLTVKPANVTTTAVNTSVIYSPNSQTVALSANIADASISTDTVGEGAVTFTVKSGSTTLGSAQSSVSGDKASASFNLTAGQVAGSYTIAVSYSDSAGNFTDNDDTSGALTIKPANVTINANSVTPIFSPNAQTLSLSANIADASIPTDTVREGIVTFTVKNGTTTIGSAQGTVSDGKASANFNLSAGQAAGSYSIAVSYSDSAGNFTDSGDTSAMLTVKPANVTTNAANTSANYSPNTQTVALSASVADTSIPTDTVGEGTVTFTLMDGSTAVSSAQGTVTGGTAIANFTLPAGQAAGNYTLAVSYSDSAGNFTDSGDTSAMLTVKPANVTTTAASTSITYSTAGQTVVLSAAAADASNTSDAVGEGIVTFTIKTGPAVLGGVQGSVSGGRATAGFNLPAGLSAADYVIAVSYSDSAGNFLDTGDANAVLAIGPAATTIQLIGATLTPNLASLTATETLTAHVGSSTSVTGGTVTFALSGQTLSANVDGNGNAVVTLSVPILNLLSPQSISIDYNDPANNLTASADAQSASWPLFNLLGPAVVTFGPNGEVVTIDLFGLLIIFTNGQLTEIDFGSIHVAF